MTAQWRKSIDDSLRERPTMLSSEADWISMYFARQDDHALGTVLNVGSSTAEFRQRMQSFIEDRVFRPLSTRGVRVIHTDIKAADGVDVVADIMKDDDLERLRGLGAKTILCSNMLEHVPSPSRMAERLIALVPPGGILVVTVPNSYPYHPDPIDNRLRPDIDQLRRLFRPLTLVDATIVEGATEAQAILTNPALLPRRLLRTFFPLPRFGKWLSALDRWRWLFKRYKVTCVVLLKPPHYESAKSRAVVGA
jgi:SAM-dependent methyltransferase